MGEERKSGRKHLRLHVIVRGLGDRDSTITKNLG